MPQARPTSARVMKAMPDAPSTRRNGSTPRSRLDAIVSASARIRIGTRPIHSLDQRNDDSLTGEVCTIQNAGPSADTAGNTKRTATAAVTKAAIARFTKA
jgi:hypothetical protein